MKQTIKLYQTLADRDEREERAMRITTLVFLLVFLFGTVACSKETVNVEPQEGSGESLETFLASSCSIETTGNHQFIQWPTPLPATTYACPRLSRMDCKVFVGEEIVESTCETANPALLQGVPSYCESSSFTTGLHGFIDGTELQVSAHRCQSLIPSLRCYYYRETSPPYKEEVTCVDSYQSI